VVWFAFWDVHMPPNPPLHRSDLEPQRTTPLQSMTTLPAPTCGFVSKARPCTSWSRSATTERIDYEGRESKATHSTPRAAGFDWVNHPRPRASTTKRASDLQCFEPASRLPSLSPKHSGCGGPIRSPASSTRRFVSCSPRMDGCRFPGRGWMRLTSPMKVRFSPGLSACSGCSIDKHSR